MFFSRVSVLTEFAARIIFFESKTIFLHPVSDPYTQIVTANPPRLLLQQKILFSSCLPSLGPLPSFPSLFYQQKQLALVFLLLHLASPQNIPFTCRLHPLCPLAIPRPCFTQFLHFLLTSASELFAVKHIYTLYNV